MGYVVIRSRQFKRQFKKLLRSGNKRALAALQDAVKMLMLGENLPSSFQNHVLSGDLRGLYECHVLPDWLLIYQIDEGELILELFATGTHSELFK